MSKMNERKTFRDFNIAMGAVIRSERLARGLSMHDLGERLGFTYQQVGKYEYGQNGCSAHIVNRIAEVFRMPIAELYKRAGQRIDAPEPTAADNDAILAARYVSKIPSGTLRRNIIDFARKCAYQETAA